MHSIHVRVICEDRTVLTQRLIACDDFLCGICDARWNTYNAFFDNIRTLTKTYTVMALEQTLYRTDRAIWNKDEDGNTDVIFNHSTPQANVLPDPHDCDTLLADNSQ